LQQTKVAGSKHLKLKKEIIVMKISKKSMVLTAAFAGLLGGTMNRVTAAPVTENSGISMSAASALPGQTAGFADTEKHACKGKNSCKGNGGCSAGNNGCKGKNSCKGKGGCATDGSKKQ
jgi:hypothetical protein